jgi:hypothetical protein
MTFDFFCVGDGIDDCERAAEVRAIATATATADPCGITNKKGKCNNGQRKNTRIKAGIVMGEMQGERMKSITIGG